MDSLQTAWFLIIAVVWTLFFVLEGFDLGVGMVVPVVGRDDDERMAIRRTIGPFWDGNEVWLIVAIGATFAAFPDWYATLLSAYYLPFVAILVSLILRATAMEYRDKATTPRRRATWDWLMAGACFLAPFLIGVALGGLLGGVPIDTSGEFTGGFTDLFQPYALFTGVTFTVLCLFQGLTFLRLRTDDRVHDRVSRLAGPVGGVVVATLVGFMIWTQIEAGGATIPGAGAWLALTFAVAAWWLATHPGHQGWGFTCSALTIAFTILGFFGTLSPNLMVSSTSAADSITKADSSASYTLTLMTVVALVMVPVVLLYTGWNYWVFRQRVTGAPAGLGAGTDTP